MSAMLGGAAEPSADELATRYKYRTTHSAKDAPPLLGDPPHPPPDPSGLPPAPPRKRPQSASRGHRARSKSR